MDGKVNVFVEIDRLDLIKSSFGWTDIHVICAILEDNLCRS